MRIVWKKTLGGGGYKMALPLFPSFAEYQEETSFGSGIDADTSCKWIGLINPIAVPAEQEYTELEFLGPALNPTHASHYRQLATGGKPIDVGITYALQDMGMRKYAFGHDASFNMDSCPSIAILTGVDIGGTMWYTQYKGIIVEKWELKFPERSYSTGTIGGKGTEIVAPTSTDPLTGVGTHALENMDDPYITQGIDSINIGTTYDPAVAIDHYVSDVILSIENKIDMPYDVNETTWAQIAGARALTRKINVTLDVRYTDFDWFAYVKNKTDLYLKFAVKGETPEVTSTFNMGAFKLPIFDNELKPGEYYGGPVTFLGNDPSMNFTQV